MKISVFLFFFGLLNLVAGSTYSQNTRISLDMKDASIESVLNKIEEISEFYFLFNHKLIDVDRKVDVTANEEPIKDILSNIFSNDVKFMVSDRQIVLTPAKFVIEFDALLQQQTVTGRVTDASTGDPMPGVNIMVKGTTSGTITDAGGKYSMSVTDRNAILVFSFIGYVTQEIPFNGRATIDVSIAGELKGLDEVVVIGYGTKRKADVTGSISVVNTDALKSMPTRSAVDALQGLASGVNVINSGAPGSSSKILIRGITNFGNIDPLIIVDGIEQRLSDISSADIESIQVLKDAGAASIYGVRGANGVILVTTKKGSKGAPTVEYSGYYGITFPIPGNPYDLLNTEGFKQVYNTALPINGLFKNGLPDYIYRGPSGAGVGMEGDPAVDISKYVWESPNKGNNYIIQKVNKQGTDWFHEMFKRAATTDHNLSVGGGTENSRYLFSAGYYDENGTMVKSYFKRYSVRINSDYQIGKYIKLGENAYMFKSDRGPVGSASGWSLPPFVPLKDIAGNWGGSFGGPELGDNPNNVASQYLASINNKDNKWYVAGNLYAEVKILKDFTARTSLGFNYNNVFQQSFSFNRPENTAGQSTPNSLQDFTSFGSTLTLTNTLQYNKVLNKHNITALFGSEAIEFGGRELVGSRKNYFTTDYNFLILQNASESIDNASSVSANSLFSLFGRLDYEYDNKYLFSGTVRRDGSSRFGSESRYGVFPSFSLAWRMSQEEFMKSLTWLTDLKLRGSWGILGSQNNVPSDNAYSLFASNISTGTLVSNYYDLKGTGTSAMQGWSQSRLGNMLTGWEENIVTNIGVDMILLNNKLDVSVEYYKKKINGLLFSEPLPATLGEASAPMINIGDIQNKGVDASFNYRNKLGGNWNYSVGANITTYKNEVVYIPLPGYFYGGSSQAHGAMVRNEVGHPVSSFYGYKFIGLFSSDEDVSTSPVQTGAAPGRLKFEDIDGDRKITTSDRTYIGDPNPDFTYGVNLGLQYKNFDLSAFFYGSQGNEIFNETRSTLDFMCYYPYTGKSNRLLNAWTPENKNTKVPKIESANNFSTIGSVSSYFVEDGSYLKLKSLILGYNFTPDLINRAGISKLRLYVQVRNLFTVTKYSGLDPEFFGESTAVRGVDGGNYPNEELNIIFGLKTTF